MLKIVQMNYMSTDRSMILRSIIFCIPCLLCACDTGLFFQPTATETLSPSASLTVMPRPTEAPTRTSTMLPTNTLTSTPKPKATATLRRTPSATVTSSPTAGPSPTPSHAQICAGLATKGSIGMYVIYIHPSPDLIWDKNPRQFLVGVCNTIPLPSVPQGKYKVVLSFPGSNHGSTESSYLRAELKPGMNEVSIGPWTPGLENHVSNCAVRAIAQTQVMYNDTPDPFYRTLTWPDGSDRMALPIQCGGNYP